MALDLDPSHLPTLGALRVRSRWTTRTTTGPRATSIRSRATRRRRASAHAPRRARQVSATRCSASTTAPSRPTRLALRGRPENEDAALPLVDEYIDRRSTGTQAEPLAEMLTRKAGKRERGEQHTLYNKLGKVARGARQGRQGASRRTRRRTSSTSPTRRRSAASPRCASASRTGRGALTNYQKVLTSLGEDETEERADVYYKLGCIKREQGQAKQAINNFEKALGVDATHRPDARGARRHLRRPQGLEAGRRLQARRSSTTSSTATSASRCSSRSATSGTTRTRTRPKAIEALEEALDLQPENHSLLHKMLQLYEATQNWARMVDTIQAHRRHGEGPRSQEQVHLHDGAALPRQG